MSKFEFVDMSGDRLVAFVDQDGDLCLSVAGKSVLLGAGKTKASKPATSAEAKALLSVVGAWVKQVEAGVQVAADEEKKAAVAAAERAEVVVPEIELDQKWG